MAPHEPSSLRPASPLKRALILCTLGWLGALLLWGGIPSSTLFADTFTVNTTADSGAGSLRQAILDANTHVGPDTIVFDIPGAGPHTITVLSALPMIEDDGTTIDGYTQSGAIEGPLGAGSPRTLMIAINGDGIAANGISIASAGNTVRGLAISGFDQCIEINGASAFGNVIEGNYLGTDVTGSAGDGPQGIAVAIKDGAHDNLIGGSGLGTGNAGNLISASGQSGSGAGVFIGSGAHDNSVQGNCMGTNAAGTAVITSRTDGVILDGETTYGNTIGGDEAGEGNLIAGFSDNGIKIQSGTYGNTVSGNWVGINAAGTAALPNGMGLVMQTGAHDNIIGGDTAAERNIVSGNLSVGIVMSWSSGSHTQSNVIQGNFIGTNPAGTAAIANGGHGIQINGCRYTVIGGTGTGEGNLVSGNAGAGIALRGSPGAVSLYGNWIGLDAAGTGAISNSSVGLYVGSHGNTIGGSAAGARNVISGNASDGISVNGYNNQIMGNYVGLDPTGTSAIGNGFDGIAVHFAVGNHIGGSGSGEGNVISGNGGRGLQLNVSSGNTVQGNTIGLNAAGNAAVPNGGQGITIIGGSQSNVIGGTPAGTGNIISGNSGSGILLEDENTTGNEILGNRIGTDSTDSLSLPNTGHGIEIGGGAHGNRIGCSGGGNRIRHNTQNGITVNSANGTEIAYNTISDQRFGIYLSGANSGTVSHNTISNNESTPTTAHSYTYSVFAYDADGPGPGEPSPYRSDDQLGNPCTAGPGGDALFYSRNTFDEWIVVCSSAYSDNPVLIADAQSAGGFDLSLLSIGGSGESNQYQIFWVKDDWADRATLEAALGGMGTVEAFVPDAILYNSGSGLFSWNPAWETGVETADPGATVSLCTGFTEYPAITSAGSAYCAGIYLSNSGSNALAANTITGNGHGISIASGTGNTITANPIHSNAALAIDLGADGVTANDSDDSDTGANNLQNFPALSSAITGAGRTMIFGTLTSTPGRTFSVELFSNAAADASGYGEGATSLGSIPAVTSGTGTAVFTAVFSGTLPASYSITATATDLSADDTSEFSAACTIVVDTSAPVVTMDSLTTNDPTPPLSGTVDDSAATIVVTVNSATYAATNNGDGTWSLPDGTLAPLDEGTYDVTATATDTIGNIGTDAGTDELTLDFGVPRITVNRLTTEDPSPPLSGSVDDPAASIAITVRGPTYAALNNGNGTWILPRNSISPGLPDGIYNVIARATDSARNIGTDATVNELVIDTYVPPSPPIPSPDPTAETPQAEKPEPSPAASPGPTPTPTPSPTQPPFPPPPEEAPLLTITKSASAGTVEAGQEITHTLRYTNAGDAPARGAAITDRLPEESTFVSAFGGGAEKGGIIRWEIGTLSPGQSGTVGFTVRVSADVADGSVITNSDYAIAAEGIGPESGPPVSVIIAAPVLFIEKWASPMTVSSPGTVTFTLNFGNRGHAPARHVAITDQIPQGTTFVNASGGGSETNGAVRWGIGDLAPGETRSVQYTIAVPAGWPAARPIAGGTCEITSGDTVRGESTSEISLPVAGLTEAAPEDESGSADEAQPRPPNGGGGDRVWVWAVVGIGAVGIAGGSLWLFRILRRPR